MSALLAPVDEWVPQTASEREWEVLRVASPQVVATIDRYLAQLSTVLAPRSVTMANTTLRQLVRWLVATTEVTAVAEITRTHLEDYKLWLATRPGMKGETLAKNTQRHRLRMIRIFFERIIEWDWDDAPRRNPLFHGDIAPRTDPLPKFLNDQDAAKLMKAARAHRLPRYRLVIEMLARTGMRAGELCDLAADAVTMIGDAYWLRIPVGKLRNDRFIPLHPDLVVLLAEWTAQNSEHIRAQKHLMADHHVADRQAHGPPHRHKDRQAGRHRRGPPSPAAPHVRHRPRNRRSCTRRIIRHGSRSPTTRAYVSSVWSATARRRLRLRHLPS